MPGRINHHSEYLVIKSYNSKWQSIILVGFGTTLTLGQKHLVLRAKKGKQITEVQKIYTNVVCKVVILGMI